jgi:hypothetical protein
MITGYRYKIALHPKFNIIDQRKHKAAIVVGS